MIQKAPICDTRVRKVPKQFSWVDQRLVRDHLIDRCTHRAAALYLFLVTVSDAQGLSYYADASIENRLAMDPATLTEARSQLIELGLIVYKRPLYQVLSLEMPASQAQKGMRSMEEIFKYMLKRA